MPFRPEFDDVYMVIKDACADETVDWSIRCLRADEIERPGQITEQILEAIRSADLIVADLTGSNPNVMYELGFAHALQKPTVILNQSVGESPFDVAGMRQIVYDRTRLVRDCRPRLVTALRAALVPPGAVPATDIPPQTAEPPAEKLGAKRESLLLPLYPGHRLVSQIQAIHVKMQLANTRSDMAALESLASELLRLVDRITVAAGSESEDLQRTVASVGNCAVELEKAQLFQQAEDLWKRGVGLCPNYVGLHYQYGDFLVDRNRISEAKRELDRGRELDPKDKRLTQLEVKLALAAGPLDRSIGERLRAEFDKDKANGRAAIAYLLFLDKARAPLEEFERVCREWSAASPPDHKRVGLRALADHLAKIDENERARELYESILPAQRAEDRHAVLHNLATVCDELGAHEEAERYWREAYAMNPLDPRVAASFSQRLGFLGEA